MPSDGKKPVIVYCGNDWRAENRTSSHHIARCLGERFPLLYIDSPSRAPRATGRDLKKIFRIFKKFLFQRPQPVGERTWHMTVPQLPFRRIAAIRELNRRVGVWMVRRAIRRLGFSHSILWYAVPPLAPLAGSLGESCVVYYCIDDYAALPHMDVQELRRLDEDLTAKADQVFVSSKPLLERKLPFNPTTRYSPHGVDVAHFRRAADPELPVATELANLKHPVIGFYGSVSGWIDIQLMTFLARARPQYTFVMIGLVSIELGEFATLPNVVLIGPQPYDSLPRWSKAFDVGLQPYVLNSQTLHSNPLKLREYLAAGKPVVSISIPEVDRFGDLVGTAKNYEQFLARIDEALATDSPKKRTERVAAVAGMSWEARVAEAWNIVEERMKEKEKQLCAIS